MASPTGTPEDFAPQIDRLLREEGSAGVIAFIRDLSHASARLPLWTLAQERARAMSDLDLSDVMAIGQAAVDEAQAQAEAVADPEAREKLLDRANVMSYNLSAALADCWPDDARPRHRVHLEAGLSAAESCLRWRRELRKGPRPFSIAWWAKGIHLLALGRTEEALEAFEESLRHAEDFARSEGASVARDATGHWMVLLSWGYVALARDLVRGSDELDDVLAALDAAAARRPDEADDLTFCAAQLRCARDRRAP